eukprot:CAMPEP_0194289694 /NCGR_PEP_ID=MMETSP0169-20130528/39630_1 /TAXON_ID=218684 /ORGANISM="Corethron pennatum, Strain L29A3" /LENGTH=70 /DNA_ID=CAMNT_0039037051 /DNA_START=101 /DNA_END=310 /DNA_ORIENTATION=+
MKKDVSLITKMLLVDSEDDVPKIVEGIKGDNGQGTTAKSKEDWRLISKIRANGTYVDVGRVARVLADRYH